MLATNWLKVSFFDSSSHALDLTDEFETVSNVFTCFWCELFARNYRCDLVYDLNRDLVELLVSIHRINTARLVIWSNLVILST